MRVAPPPSPPRTPAQLLLLLLLTLVCRSAALTEGLPPRSVFGNGALGQQAIFDDGLLHEETKGKMIAGGQQIDVDDDMPCAVDDLLVLIMMYPSTSTAGLWETVVVTAVDEATNTVTLDRALTGQWSLADRPVIVHKPNQYQDLIFDAQMVCNTMHSSTRLGGTVVIVANETITFGPNALIRCGGKGFRGGPAPSERQSGRRGAGWTDFGNDIEESGWSGGGGGGVTLWDDLVDKYWGFPGAGGHGAGGSGQDGGEYYAAHHSILRTALGSKSGTVSWSVSSTDAHERMYHGCGGGSGSQGAYTFSLGPYDFFGYPGAAGGNGGGVVIILAPHIDISQMASGTIKVDGTPGSNAHTVTIAAGGGGGGGGGGSILLMSNTIHTGPTYPFSTLRGEAGESFYETSLRTQAFQPIPDAGAGGGGKVTVSCVTVTDENDPEGQRCGTSAAGNVYAYTKASIIDFCENDENKLRPGFCGCGLEEPPGATEWDSPREAACAFIDHYANDEFICVDTGTPRANTSTPCAVCDGSNDRFGWSSIEGTCYIDGQCHDDSVRFTMENAVGETVIWPCEACNRSLSQTEWTYVERTCRVDMYGTPNVGAPPAPFDSKFDYYCLEMFEKSPVNECQACVGDWRLDDTKYLGTGYVMDADYFSCSDDNTCTSTDHCRRGECVTHFETMPTKFCSGEGCVGIHPDLASVHLAPDGEAPVASVCSDFVITRPEGVVLTRVAVPLDADVATEFKLANTGTGEILLDLQLGILGTFDSGSLRVFELPPSPEIFLPRGFRGTTCSTTDNGVGGFVVAGGPTSEPCADVEAVDWISFTAVATDGIGEVPSRSGVHCSAAAGGGTGTVADFPADLFSVLLTTGGAGVVGSTSRQDRFVRFIREPEYDLATRLPLRWSGPPSSRFLTETEYLWAGQALPPLASNRTLCGRVEGASGNLPQYDEIALRIVIPVDSLLVVPGSPNDALRLESGKIRGIDTAVTVRVLLNDAEVNATQSVPKGQTGAFAADFGAISAGDVIVVELTGEHVSHFADPLTDFGARFDRLSFKLLDGMTRIARASFPGAFTRQTAMLGTWRAECAISALDVGLVPDIADEGETVSYDDPAVLELDTDEESVVVHFSAASSPVTIDMEPVANDGSDPVERLYTDNGERNTHFWLDVDDSGTVAFSVDVVVGTTTVQSFSCASGASCSADGDTGMLSEEDRIRVVLTSSGSGATGKLHFHIGETALINARGPTLVFSEAFLCNVDDACWLDGTVNPANPCQKCETALNINGWTNQVYQPCQNCTADACMCSVQAECVEDTLGATTGGLPLPPLPTVAQPVLVIDTAPVALASDPVPAETEQFSIALPEIELPPSGTCTSFLDKVADEVNVASADFFETVSDATANPLANHPEMAALITTVLETIIPFAEEALDVDIDLDLDAIQNAIDSGQDLVGAITNSVIESAGNMCFSFPDVVGDVGIAQMASDVLGITLPDLPLPDGFPSLDTLVPKGTSIALPLTEIPFPDDIDFDVDIPDAEIFDGAVSWTGVSGRFVWSERYLAASGELTLVVPRLEFALGTYFVDTQFKFVDFDSLPGVAMSIEAVQPAPKFPVIPDVLYVSPVFGSFDVGAAHIQLQAEVEIVLPQGIGSAGTYLGLLDIRFDRDGSGPPSFEDAENDVGASADAEDVGGANSASVIFDVQAVDPLTLNVIPDVLTLTPVRFLVDTTDARVAVVANVGLNIPGLLDFGEYEAKADLYFDGGGLFDGSAFVSVELTPLSSDPLVLVPDYLEITPLYAVMSTEEAFVDVAAEVWIAVPEIGELAHVAGRVLLLWDDTDSMTGGNAPDLTIVFEAVDPDNLVQVDLIPGVLSVAFVEGELNSADGFIRASAQAELGIPGLGSIGGFDAVFEVNFEGPGLRGDACFTASFDGLISVDLIPDLVTFSLTSGSIESCDSTITIAGGIDVPFFPEGLGGQLTISWPKPNFGGTPEVKIGLDPGSSVDGSGPVTLTASNLLEMLGLNAADLSGLPLPISSLALSEFELDLTGRSVLVTITALNPGERLTLVPRIVSVFDLKLTVSLTFGKTATRETTSSVASSNSKTEGAAPGRGSSTSVGFALSGSWLIGDVVAHAEVGLVQGEWFINVLVDELSFAGLAERIIGGIPGPILDFASAFDMRNVEISLRLGTSRGGAALGSAGRTRLFHVRAEPDSDLIRDIAGESYAEILLGTLDGKKVTAVILAIDIDNVLGYIGDQINFPQLASIPFFGEMPFVVALSSKELDFRNDNRLVFGDVVPPPSVASGISFGFTLSAPEDICTGVCRAIVDEIPGFNDIYVSAMVGKVNGQALIAFEGFLPLELEIGPIFIDFVSFNVAIPIPNVIKIEIWLAASVDVKISPTHTVFLDFKIGYKPYTLFVNAMFGGYLPNFILPFFTAGDFFVEAEINQSPTIAIGTSLLFGRDCLDYRGRPKGRSDCGLAKGAVGVGVDQFVALSLKDITIKMLLSAVFGDDLDFLPIPDAFGSIGYKGYTAMSFSAKERTLPDGTYMPVGLYFEGPIQYPLIGRIAQVKILFPITPTMINLLLGNAASIGQIVAEITQGYELHIEGSLPPIVLARGAIKLVRSKSNTRQGAAYALSAIAKPLDVEFSYSEEFNGYLNIVDLVEISAKVKRTLFGFEADFMFSYFGMRASFYVFGEMMGGNFAPKSIADTSFRVRATMDARRFLDVVLGPVNDFVDGFVEALTNIIRIIPFIGDWIADRIIELVEFLKVWIYTISIEAEVSPRRAGFKFELAGRIFGRDRHLRVQVSIDPQRVIQDMWNNVIKPFFKKLYDPRRGPSFMHCNRSETFMGVMCAKNCRPKYKTVLLSCWEKCKPGFEDLGVTCTKVYTKEVELECKEKIFGVCVWYWGDCPSGYTFVLVACIKVVNEWKHIYARGLRLPHECSNNGLTSKEGWTLFLPMCYEPCGYNRRGVFNNCMSDDIIPGFLKNNWCNDLESCASLLS